MRESDVSSLPLVAIVGRANVGKSRLFNRLVGARRALVEDRPGVTRDRILVRTRIEGREVRVVDTGGLDPAAREGIPAAVLAQVEQILHHASVLLFVVDVRAGLLPLDREIAGVLRSVPARVIVVANKADSPLLDAAAAEFHALGFPEIIPTSAEHKLGMADLYLSIAERLPEVVETPRSQDGAARVAIVGRPNAGKSSLLNRLVGEEHAIVSEVPGTTRDATDARLRVPGVRGEREVVLIDTAGLRRPGRRGDHLERGSAYMALRAIERADVALLILDAGVGVTDQDAKIARLTLDCGRPIVLVLNKWDLVVDDGRQREIQRQLERRLVFLREPTVLRVSALTGQAVQQILPRALELLEEISGEVSTSALNRALREAVERNPPPMEGRRRARIFYATVVSKRPFTVLLFVNDPALISRNYRQYLTSFLRKAFGLRSAPIRLRLRARPRAESGDREAAGGSEEPEGFSGHARLGSARVRKGGGGDDHPAK